jgi:hypothetical protein
MDTQVFNRELHAIAIEERSTVSRYSSKTRHTDNRIIKQANRPTKIPTQPRL